LNEKPQTTSLPSPGRPRKKMQHKPYQEAKLKYRSRREPNILRTPVVRSCAARSNVLAVRRATTKDEDFIIKSSSAKGKQTRFQDNAGRPSSTSTTNKNSFRKGENLGLRQATYLTTRRSRSHTRKSWRKTEGKPSSEALLREDPLLERQPFPTPLYSLQPALTLLYNLSLYHLLRVIAATAFLVGSCPGAAAAAAAAAGIPGGIS